MAPQSNLPEIFFELEGVMGKQLSRGYCFKCQKTIKEEVLAEDPDLSFDLVVQSMYTGFCTFCKLEMEYQFKLDAGKDF